MNHCQCGKRINKFATKCGPCHKKEMLKHAQTFRTIQKGGRCPQCESKLVPNISLAGTYWLQCAQYGMLRDTHGTKMKPECHYQILAGKDEVDQLNRQEIHDNCVDLALGRI